MVVMQVTAPDYLGALLLHLRAQPLLQTMFPGLPITTQIPVVSDSQDKRPMAYLTLQEAPGHVHPSGLIFYPRIDARCYGTTQYNAQRLWAALDSILCPADMHSNGFQAGDALWYDIQMAFTPRSLVDENFWPMKFAGYIGAVRRIRVDDDE